MLTSSDGKQLRCVICFQSSHQIQ